MKVLIDINENDLKCIKASTNKTSSDYIISNGTPIPDNATNGDVMRIMFPKIGLYNEWYDEPYQKCGNSEYLGGELYEGEFENR